MSEELDNREAIIEILKPKEASNAKLSRIIDAQSQSISEPRRKTSKVEDNKEKELELILSDDDFKFYKDKKEDYLSRYPELEDPFDLDDLHLMIMEQVIQRNLLKRKKKSPAVDISDSYEKSVKRQLDLKKSLSVRRTDRVKSKEVKKQTINIADMSVVFSDKDKMREFQDRLSLLKEEEEKLGEEKAGQIIE